MSSHTEEGFTIDFGCNMRAKLSDDDCAQSRELKFVVKVVPCDIVVAFAIDIFRVVMTQGKVKITFSWLLDQGAI